VRQHEVGAVQAECDVLTEANTRLRSELDTSRQDTAVQLSVRQQVRCTYLTISTIVRVHVYLYD
jgi:hypothetical protein